MPDLDESEAAIPDSAPSQKSVKGQDDIIVCIGNDLADKIIDENGKIITKDYQIQGKANANAKSFFPSGGPTQSSWLDLRDIYGNGLSGFAPGTVSRLVEIGIIDLSTAVSRG